MPGSPRSVRSGDRTKCTKCRKWFPTTVEHFLPSPECLGGYTATCRRCNNKVKRDWKRKHGDRIAMLRRERYAATKGVETRARERRRAERAPIRFRAQMLRAGMRTRSRELGIPFDADYFSVERLMGWLENNPCCECCGRGLDVGYKFDKQKRDSSPSMDRFVPRLGYVQGNVALLCWRCNNLKRDASATELECVAAWIRSKSDLPHARAA